MNVLNSDCVIKRSRLKIKTLLTPAEIEEVKQQVKSDTFQEEDEQSEEEQQAATTILEPVEIEVIPESEHTTNLS